MSHNFWCLGYIEDFSGAMSLFLGHTGLILLLSPYTTHIFRLTGLKPLLYLNMPPFLGLAGLFPLLFSICPSSLDSRDFLPCFFTHVPSRFCNSMK